MIPGASRLALRRRRKAMIALGLSATLALSVLGIQSASASTRSSLALSLNPDRSNAVRLDGSTVKGNIYVFVRNSKTLDKVDFYLDSSSRTKPPVRTVTDPPFDFAGTADDGTAVPYDTTKLADGSHSISVVLTWSNGTTSRRRGSFTVANKGVAPTTSPSPTTTTPNRLAGGTNYDCAGNYHFGSNNDATEQRRRRLRKHRPRSLRNRVPPRHRVLAHRRLLPRRA